LWNGEAIEIYIDANNNKHGSYDGKDNQIIEAYNVSSVFSMFALNGLQHAWAPIAGGYAVELAIPWSQLGITAPAAGLSIGFDLGNDDDDTGGGRQGQLVWNGTINNYQNTSGFGTLTLNSTVASGPAARPLIAVQPAIEETRMDISIYPNPVSNGALNIATQGMEGKATIEIINFAGTIVENQNKTIQDSTIKLELPKLASGVYLLRLGNGNKVVTKKFIVR
jgi:hypothetical protein